MTASELIPIVKEALVNLGCELEPEKAVPLIGVDVVGTRCDGKYIIRVYDGKGNKHIDALNKLAVLEYNHKILLVSKKIRDDLGERHKDNVIILDKNRLGDLKSYKITPTKILNFSATDDYPNVITDELLSFCKSATGHRGAIKCIIRSSNSKGVVEIEEDGKSSYGRLDVDNNDPEWREFNDRVPWITLKTMDAEWNENKRYIEFYSHPYDPRSQLPHRIKHLCNWIFGLKLQRMTCTYYEIPDIRLITSSR